MTFEEANKLARKVFVGNPSNVYANNFTLEEYEALNEAFTGGQPENPCYHCARRTSCEYQQFVKNITGCNYRIVEKH